MKTKHKVEGVLLLGVVLFCALARQSETVRDLCTGALLSVANALPEGQTPPQESGAALLQTDRGQFVLKATRQHCQSWNVDPRTLPETSPMEVAVKRALIAERL